jgi:hypothetical protein
MTCQRNWNAFALLSSSTISPRSKTAAAPMPDPKRKKERKKKSKLAFFY